MDTLDFISSLTGHLAWPISVASISLMLRQPIKSALKDVALTKMKLGPGGLELEMEKILSKAEDTLDGDELLIVTPPVNDQPVTPPVNDQPATPPVNDQPATPPVNDQPVTSLDSVKFARLIDLAKISPRAAVMEGHAILESELRSAVPHSGQSRHVSMNALIRLAVKREIIPGPEASVLSELNYLRNRVAHESDHAITVDTAIRYIETVWQAVISLRLREGKTHHSDNF